MDFAAQLIDVSVKRGRGQVLQHLNLDLRAGQIIGLLGPSGSGKSTIMRTLVGVQSKVEGQVKVLGQAAGSSGLATRVAYATQSSSVFDDISLRDNLVYAIKMLGAPKDRIAQVIAEVGLQGFEKRIVSTLSGGERNRVSLAMAMVGSPEFLILDEPTVGLDPVLRADIWSIFRTLANSGKTLLVSSHVMDEAERCDSLVFVRDGKILASGTLKDILNSTHTKSAEDAFLALARRVD